jgi:hypothetical protein
MARFKKVSSQIVALRVRVCLSKLCSECLTDRMQRWSLGVRIKYGFYSSMFGTSSTGTQQAVPVCWTRKCTSPTFSSIGICSDCTNVSSYVTRDLDPTNNLRQLPSGASADTNTLASSFSSNPTIEYHPVIDQTIADSYYLSGCMLPNDSNTKAQAFQKFQSRSAGARLG